MMGTLARFLAVQQIDTLQDSYWADVEGDIEDVNRVLKITRIRVTYHLKIRPEKAAGAREALRVYLAECPAAQSMIDCIEILDNLVIETPV